MRFYILLLLEEYLFSKILTDLKNRKRGLDMNMPFHLNLDFSYEHLNDKNSKKKEYQKNDH